MSDNKKPKLQIIFYSVHMHVYKLALAIKEGAELQGLVDVELYQVPETLSLEILAKKGTPPRLDLPIITPEILKEGDGFLFGFPAYYGMLPAQLKQFFDSCGQLWVSGAMTGKLTGVFNSTQLLHSGQETTPFTFVTILTHFGMLFVPNGYSCQEIHNDCEFLGGSPWGASIVASKFIKSPSTKELAIAKVQGKNFAQQLARYHHVEFDNVAIKSPLIVNKLNNGNKDFTETKVEDVSNINKVQSILKRQSIVN